MATRNNVNNSNYERPVMMAGSPEGARPVYVSPFYYDETPLDYLETLGNSVVGTGMNLSRLGERAARYALSPVIAGATYLTTDASLPEAWQATKETIPELSLWVDMSGNTNPAMNPDGSPNFWNGVEAITGVVPLAKPAVSGLRGFSDAMESAARRFGHGLTTHPYEVALRGIPSSTNVKAPFDAMDYIPKGVQRAGEYDKDAILSRIFPEIPETARPNNIPNYPSVSIFDEEAFPTSYLDDVVRGLYNESTDLVPYKFELPARITSRGASRDTPIMPDNGIDQMALPGHHMYTPEWYDVNISKELNIPDNIKLLNETNPFLDAVRWGLNLGAAGSLGAYTGEKIDQAIANVNEAEARREQAQKDGANIAEILDSKNAGSASSQPSRFSPTAQTGGSPQPSSFLSQAGQSPNPSQLSSFGSPQTSLSGYTPYTLDFELAMPPEEALNYDPKIDEWYTNLKAKLNIIPREELIGLETPVNLKPFIDEAGKGFGIGELKSDKEVETINSLISNDLNGLYDWLNANVGTPILNKIQERIKAYEEGIDSALNTINSTTRLLTSAENEASNDYSNSFWSWLALILTIPFSIRRGISPMETWDKIITSRVNLNNRVRELRRAREAQIESLNTARTAFTDYARLAPSLIEAESRQTPNLNTAANVLNGLANYNRAQFERNPVLTDVDQARINLLQAQQDKNKAQANWWANRPYPSEASDNIYDKSMEPLLTVYAVNPNALSPEGRRMVENYLRNRYPTDTNPTIFSNQNTNETWERLNAQQ